MKSFATRIFVIILVGLFAFSAVNAQFDYQNLSENDLIIKITPEYPQPNSEVTLSLTSYAVDLNRLLITWAVDGQILKSGRGEKEFVVKTGNIGKLTQVFVTVEINNEEMLEREISIIPLDINLLWEAKTYTPPFYKGKATYTNQSAVKIVADPVFFDIDGQKIAADQLVYKWTIDGHTRGDLSGYGKYHIEVPGKTLLPQTTVEVEVTDFEQTLKMQKKLVLDPVSPKILTYENHPLYGLLTNRAIKNIVADNNNEVAVSVIPYFFSAKTRANEEISYTWSMNGKSLPSLDRSNEAVFKPEIESSGRSVISVAVENLSAFSQTGQTNFSIEYGDLN